MSFLRDLPPTAFIALIACSALLIVVLLASAVRARARTKTPESAQSEPSATHPPQPDNDPHDSAPEHTGDPDHGPAESDGPTATQPLTTADAAGHTDADHNGDLAPVQAPDVPEPAVAYPAANNDKSSLTPDPLDPPEPVLAHASAALDLEPEDDPYVTASLDEHGSVVEPGWPSPGELASGFNPDVFDPLPPDSGTEYEDDDGGHHGPSAAAEYHDASIDDDAVIDDEDETDSPDGLISIYGDEGDDDEVDAIDDHETGYADEDIAPEFTDSEELDFSETDATQVIDTSDVDWDDDGFDPATGWATDDEIHVSVSAGEDADDALDVDLDFDDDLDIESLLSLADDDLDDLARDDDDDVNMGLTMASATTAAPDLSGGLSEDEPAPLMSMSEDHEADDEEPWNEDPESQMSMSEDHEADDEEPWNEDPTDVERAWEHGSTRTDERSLGEDLSVPYPAPGTLPAHRLAGGQAMSTPVTFEGIHAEAGEMTAQLAFGGQSPIVVDLGPLVALRGSVDLRIERDARSGGLRVVVDPEPPSMEVPAAPEDAEAAGIDETTPPGPTTPDGVVLTPWDETESASSEDSAHAELPGDSVSREDHDRQPPQAEAPDQPLDVSVSPAAQESPLQSFDPDAGDDTPWEVPDTDDAIHSDGDAGDAADQMLDGPALLTAGLDAPESAGEAPQPDSGDSDAAEDALTVDDPPPARTDPRPLEDGLARTDASDDYEDPAQILAEIRDRLAALDERRLSSRSPI